MEANVTYEDDLFQPLASQPASPGAEMVTTEFRDLLERQHQEVLLRFDVQDELLRQCFRRGLEKSQLSASWTPSRTSRPPQSPSKLSKISEVETPGTAALSDKASAGGGSMELPVASSPRGGRGSDSGSKSKQGAFMTLKKPFRPVFQTFTQADMALKNLAAAVDSDRQKRRFEYASSRSSEGASGQCLRDFVKSPAFDSFFALLVLTNTVFIGIEVQETLMNPVVPFSFIVVQYIYTGFFCFELLLRAFAGGKGFFCGQDWLWSWLDVLVVASSVFEIAFDILASQGVAHASGLRALRFVRITRFLKTLRLIRVFRFVQALRTLITSILYTLRSLFWALVLLALIIYLFSVLLAQAVSDYQLSGSNERLPHRAFEAANRYYSSLPKTMLSLFMTISGGVSWEEVLEPLEHISLLWVIVFLFYVQFTYFAVLNVLTGVFCQSAVESAQNDHANVVQSMLANKEAHVEKIRALFSKLGAEEEGIITYAMFEEGLSSPAVMQYFETLGLDVWDAWSFFKLLDLDSGGSVEIEEFFKGCLRFRGQARGVDVGKILHDQAWLIKNQGKFHSYMEMKMRRIVEMLSSVTGFPIDDNDDGLLSQQLGSDFGNGDGSKGPSTPTADKQI